MHHHLDDALGFLDAPGCAALAGDLVDADCYVCGPGPFMDTVDAGLDLRAIPADRRFGERFVVPDGQRSTTGVEGAEQSTTETVVIRLARAVHTLEYQAGDTVLETARRAGLKPPFSCEAGSCATCMAHLEEGSVRMRVNNALSAEEVADGWVLTCQSLPTSPTVRVDYDA